MAARRVAATRTPPVAAPRVLEDDQGEALTPLPRPRRSRASLVAAPAPVARDPFGSSAERWREAGRVVVVALGVALIVLVANRGGLGLAVLAVLDWGAYLLPPLLVAVGLDLLRRSSGVRPLLRLEEVNGLLSLFFAGLIAFGGDHHGGPLGNALADELGAYFGAAGVPLACTFLTALGLVLGVHLTLRQVWLALAVGGRAVLRSGRGASRFALAGARGAGRRLRRGRVRRLPAGSGWRALPIIEVSPEVAPVEAPESVAAETGKRGRRGGAMKAAVAVPVVEGEDEEDARPVAEAHALGLPGWPEPPLSILDPVPAVVDTGPSDNALRMRVIEDTLAAFNVRARVVGAHSGPTVTQFDVQPERGVRVQRITALHNDLALALAARSIRIQAPVPGHPVIGIEIPNAKTTMVTLREVLESEACARMVSPLKVALGKDVSGGPVVADLARMPHLLIAGATGSGKSVCLNSLISCLLFHNSPDRLRLLMVDPKMVELSVYNEVPHLLAPVVTDVKKVTGTLKWALKEMHRRYKLFAQQGARNLARFNELQTDHKQRMPFIVLIIDELADLMMVSPDDVEDSICRLAQLARATGIHLVVATQRPSVDVITGLIKANFPARIAFAVSSQVDSRTILDGSGAEKLLGRGDMLYLPSDEGKPIRVQGAYLSDREIEELVRFWKFNPPREVEQIPEAELAEPTKEEEPDADDKLLNEAIRVLREYRRASVSLLQRRLSIGYTRAARLLDVLEERGVVGPSEDGRSRVVLETSSADLDDSPDVSGDEDDQAPPL